VRQDPRTSGGYINYEAVEIVYTNPGNLGRQVGIIGYRGQRQVVLGGATFQRDGGCPTRAWVRNKALLWSWQGDWEFTYDEEYDRMFVHFSTQLRRDQISYDLEFERIADGPPCDERELREIDEQRREQEEREARWERERRRDEPRQQQKSRSGSQRGTTENENDECPPKIHLAWYEDRGLNRFLIITGFCFPMNFELWIDGHVQPNINSTYKGDRQIESVVFPPFGFTRNIQIKDLDTGRKSNIFQVRY
jgi:hypothetical protein